MLLIFLIIINLKVGFLKPKVKLNNMLSLRSNILIGAIFILTSWIVGAFVYITYLEKHSQRYDFAISTNSITPIQGCAYSGTVKKHAIAFWPLLQLKSDYHRMKDGLPHKIIKENSLAIINYEMTDQEIQTRGNGFYYRQGKVFFAASDCTDPRTNQRNYSFAAPLHIKTSMLVLYILSIVALICLFKPVSKVISKTYKLIVKFFQYAIDEKAHLYIFRNLDSFKNGSNTIIENVNSQPDRASFLYKISIIYFLLPCLVFLIGFTQWYISLVAGAALVAATYFDFRFESSLSSSFKLFKPRNLIFISIFLVAMAWTALFGVGFVGPAFLLDQYVHHMIFRDLYLFSWPVKYENMPPDLYFLSYPLGWYLVPAALAKVFGWTTGLIALYFWTVIGIALIWSWLNLFFSLASFGLPFLFLYFLAA